MSKISLLFLLSAVSLTGLAQSAPNKVSIGGRALSTQGKTYQPLSPKANLMLGASSSGFSQDGIHSAPRQRQSSRIISTSGSDMQGYLKASAVVDYPPGWYDVSVDGDVELLYTNTEMMGSCGYVRNGKICQFTAINSYGYYWFYYSEYDLKTGEKLYEVELPDNDMRNYVVNCTYNEAEDMVYMQTYSKNFTQMAWSSFNPETMERTYLNNGLSWDDNRVVAIGANPRDNRIYGVKADGEYVEIDRMTGLASKVTDLTVSPAEYSQAMLYSPIERGFVWAAMLADNTSGFYRLDPATGAVSLLGQMPVQNQFLMLYTPDKDAADNAPGMPSFSAAFDGPSLTGILSVELPSKSFGGEALPAGTKVEAEVAVEGEVLLTLSGAPGEKVSGEVTLAQGNYPAVVRCRVAGSADWGPERKDSFYVGYDEPFPPASVRISGDKIYWSAPKMSVHGGYFNPDHLTYSVYLNDIPVTSEPVEAKSVTFEKPTSLAIYHPRVVAHADGMSSEPGVGVGVKYGDLLEFPFSFTPSALEFNLFSIVDANKDGNSWYYFDGKDFMYYNSRSSSVADDWLVLPLTDFSDAEHLYRLTFDLRSLLNTRPEDIAVWLMSSTDPATGLVKKIADYPAFPHDEWTTQTFKFNVEEPGQYHIGFHCSTVEGFQVMLRELKGLKTADTMKAPGECKGVKLTGAEGGKLEASVSFLAPTKALDGTALPAGKEITVIARTAGGEGSVKVMPGAKGEMTFPCVQGMNDVTLVAANDGGEGFEYVYQVFAGQEKPGKVQNLTSTVSDDNLTWTLTWEPPTEGESGGYVNPDEIGYNIYNVSGGELSFLEDIGKRTTYTYTVPAGSQSLEQIAIGPYNIAGSASSSTFRGTSAILGTPLKVPFTETFGYGIPRYLPNVISRPNSAYSVSWSHGDPTAIVYDALSQDYGCMFAQPSTLGLSLGRVEIPRVSTAGYKNICFKLRAFRFPQGGLIRILGRANNAKEYVVIGEFDSSKGAKGYVDSVFKLPESLQNLPWISLAIEAEFDCESTNTYVIIDDYTLLDLPDNDMAVALLSGPDRLTIGESGEYSATVLNLGKEAQTSSLLWEVEDADGNLLFSEEGVVSPLDPEESEESKMSFSTDGAGLGGFATVKATVKADPDDSDANDTKSMKVALLSAASGKVSDLKGAQQGDKVLLEWSAPQMKYSRNEDFSGLDHGMYDAEFGDWTNFDGDGKNVCSISGVDLPDAGQPKGWQVIDDSLHELFDAAKGSRLILAMTPADESAANDWLISPEIVGGSELVFSANVLTTGFAEEFEVLVSTTDNEWTSFRRVASFVKDTMGWETYMLTLPADARYFAIRYCSVDQFGLMLDNIDYVPSFADERRLEGYDVYRDGNLLGSVSEPAFVDENPLEEADYFVIPVVVENGVRKETLKSNVARVSPSGVAEAVAGGRVVAGKGVVTLLGLDGHRVSVHGSDALCVADLTVDAPRVEIAVPAGVCLVSVDGRSFKLVVR